MFYHSVFEDYNIIFSRYLKCIDIDYIYYPTNSLITLILSTFCFIFVVARVFTYFSNLDNIFFRILRPIYELVLGLVRINLGNNKLYYTFFFFYLFLFILFNNLFGILPFTFTQTSHLTTTLFLASIVWVTCLFKGIYNHGKHFLSLFCPKGISPSIIPLLVFIESISYFFRVVSLGLRLFANIFAGHVLLETVGIFLYKMFFASTEGFKITSFIIGILPFLFFCILCLFETIVAFLQAYIFTILSIIYLAEAYELH